MDAKTTEAVELLRRLIATPSTSRDESRTADLLFAFLEERGAAPERLHNNVFARSADFDPARPTLLLNSHHDTVRPAASYTRDPFTRPSKATVCTVWAATTPELRSCRSPGRS